MRDNYRRSVLFVGLCVCILCAIECQKLPTTLESRENGGRRHSQQRNAAMHLHTTSTSSEWPCARRVAGGLSTRRAINLITGDTFWEPVIGRKPVNRLTGYRFTSLQTTAVNNSEIIVKLYLILHMRQTLQSTKSLHIGIKSMIMASALDSMLSSPKVKVKVRHQKHALVVQSANRLTSRLQSTTYQKQNNFRYTLYMMSRLFACYRRTLTVCTSMLTVPFLDNVWPLSMVYTDCCRLPA